MEKRTWTAYLELAGAMMIVGSSVVVGKLVITAFPLFLALLIRFMIGLPLLFILTHQRRELRPLRRSEVIAIGLQALTGVFLFNVLLLYGLQQISAAQSGLITSTTPAVLALLGWLILRERLSAREWMGAALSAVGVLIVTLATTPTATEAGGNPLLGTLLVIGAVICEALFTIFRKRGAQNVPPLLNATLVTAFGLVLCLPLGLAEARTFDFSTLTLANGVVLLYYGVFVTSVAYILWFSGVSRVSTGVAGIFTGLLPISALVLSALILHEPFTPAHLVGLLLVLSGITCIALPVRKPSAPDSVNLNEGVSPHQAETSSAVL